MITLECDLCPHAEAFKDTESFQNAFRSVDMYGLPQPHWGPFYLRHEGNSMHVCPECYPKTLAIMLEHEDNAVTEIRAKLKKAKLATIN